jgi:Domain of unknown function (DUF4838)/Glycosyl hydrolases family 2, sugar binding domain
MIIGLVPLTIIDNKKRIVMKILKALVLTLAIFNVVTCLHGGEKATISIVIKHNAPEVVKFAAGELQNYLKKISGKEFPVVTDDKDVSGQLIMVGQSKYTDKLSIRKNFSAESFIIKSVGNNLVLIGDDLDKGKGAILPFDYRSAHKGSLYAVYTFLEKYFGTRWFWPGSEGEVVPKRARITIPRNIDIYEEPAFLWRYCWFVIATDKYPAKVKDWDIPIWSMRNKMGLAIGSPWSFSHSWGRYLTDKYFADHPEYYALINGKRTLIKHKGNKLMGWQVCTTNPDVIRIFVDRIRKRNKPTADTIVSISPNDGLGFCECEKCKALDHPELYGPEEGYKGQVLSDRIYTFVNKIAREIKKTHPKLRLGLFSYTVIRPAPRALKKLEDNVVISMTQTNAHYRNKAYKKRNRKRLKEWKSKCSAFIGRDYLGNYSFASVMHPQTKIIAEDLVFMKKNNYIGFYSECSLDFATNFLNYYVSAKLMWQPDQKVDKIIDDICQKAYGAGGSKMKEFFAMMEASFNKCKTVGIHPGNIADWYSKATINRAYQLLKEAESRAKTQAEKKRIRYNLTGLQYTDKVVALFRIYRQLSDCGLPMGIVGYEPNFSKKYSREQIVELLKAARKTGSEIASMIEKYRGTTLLQPYPFCRQNTVKRWFKAVDEYWRLYGNSDKNKIVTQLPDLWKFKLDPKNIGVGKGWFKSDFADSSWKLIRIDKTWEKQGYDKYDGYAWYRLAKVKISEKNSSGKYILHFGAIDESCWVYVNGILVGKYLFDAARDPDGWKKPHSFDISNALKPGTENCIAVRVLDQGYAGGIWRRASLVHEMATKQTNKVIFSEGFESDKPKFRQHTKNAKSAIVDTEFHKGGKSLNIQVLKAYPATLSISLPKIKVSGLKEYMMTISFKSENVKANKDQRRAWLKTPRLPSVRIIQLNKSSKVCVPIKKYIWFGGAFKEKTKNWELIRKVFRTSDATKYLSLTLFFNAQGKYWIDEIILEELK